MELMEFVKDRPGHDKKYGINNEKVIKELSWKPKMDFDSAIKNTIRWYIDNSSWWKNLTK